ncbi:MAG: ABC transporter substrate-binding protein, partial [Brevinema sp.]
MKLLVILLLLGACSSPKDLKEVHVSYVKTPLNVPTIINVTEALFSNQMADQQINVTYHTLYTGSQQVSALASKDLDIVPTMGNTSAIIGLANDAPIKIIGMFGRSPKAFVLATKDPNINSIVDLKGKKIGGPKGTVLHQLLLRILENEQMSINDIEFISLGVQEALPAMLTGDLDAALLV